MNKPKIILVGAGGHAVSCIDVIEQEGKYEIVGLVGTKEEKNLKLLDYEILGTDQDLRNLNKDVPLAIITVGQIKSAQRRLDLFEQALKIGFEIPTVVSPRAYVSPHSILGPGTMVMHDAIVNANVKIGQNCIINTSALVEHDSTIGDHTHISTGAILNGNSIVGSRTFVGSGVIVKQDLEIGSDVVLGMGSLVLTSVPSQTTYLGRN